MKTMHSFLEKLKCCPIHILLYELQSSYLIVFDFFLILLLALHKPPISEGMLPVNVG